MNDFMLDWNSVIAYRNPLDPDDDPNYGVLIKISDYDNSPASKAERMYYRSKCEKKLRRAKSLMMAQSKFEERQLKDPALFRQNLHRSNSSVDLHVGNQTPRMRKRVSFSFINENIMIDVELTNSPRRHCSDPNPNVLRPQRPILRKRSRATSLPLSHMDFDSFAAWRRGSRLSDDVVEYLTVSELKEVQKRHAKKMKLLKKEEKEAARQLKQRNWNLCSAIKNAFLVCFSSKRCMKTSPENSNEINQNQE
ncbi:hypothetical protein WR25_09586 [Diploscapter pachys]|uniref:Uncharacterized protein n=1 Tax=Diploscapter pachys TaxID=2018661 RepID=A0A2A2KXA7_9BILA|nr:hypothetical protein WR25_09586 [Diploscapter pachys]